MRRLLDMEVGRQISEARRAVWPVILWYILVLFHIKSIYLILHALISGRRCLKGQAECSRSMKPAQSHFFAASPRSG